MKKLLASLLCVMMVFCMMPGMAFATEGTTYMGTVVGLPAGIDVQNGNSDTVTVTNSGVVALNYSPSDPSIERTPDAWWVGFKITAPDGLAISQTNDIQFSNNRGASYKSFWKYKDSKDTDTVHYMTFWVPISAKNYLAFNAAESTMNWKYIFKWNGDNGQNQIVNISIDPSKVKLMLSGVDVVALCGDHGFTTLQDAINAAEDGQTVTLIKDVTLSENLILNAGKKVILDLNGKSINAGDNYVMVAHGNLDITGVGEVSSTNSSYAFKLVGSESDVADYSVLTIGKDVTVNSSGYGAMISGRVNSGDPMHYYGTEVTINGTINSAYGIYVNGQINKTEGNVPVFNVNDGAKINGGGLYAAGYAIWNLAGDITGEHALSLKSGAFHITGGTYHSTGAFADPALANNNGSEDTGAALSLTSNDSYAKKLDVIVSDGIFTSDNGYSIYEGIAVKSGNPAASESYATLDIRGGSFTGNADKGAMMLSTAANKKIITGGTFSSDVADYTASNYYSFKKSSNNTYIVEENAINGNWSTDKNLTVGQTYQMEFTPGNECVTWESSNPEIAAVDETGLVTAKSAGNVRIFACVKDGIVKNDLLKDNRCYGGFNISYPYIPTTPTTPTDNVTNSGSTTAGNATTSADLSNTTSTSNGTTTATVDKTTADKIVDKAVENKSEEVVIDATANTTTAADSTVIAQVGIPTAALEAIAEKTEADVTVKTDVAEVKLDNTAAGAVAEQAAGDTVQLVVEKVAEDAEKVQFELKVVCSEGNVISDFKGGNVAVTVAVPKAMESKEIVCVYIDENGRISKVNGQKNADGTYTFFTGHFSTYALMTAEEADAAIEAQAEEIKNIKIKLQSKQVKLKNGKKAIKLTWTADSDVEFDGVEIYRSTKRYSGFGKTPIYTATKDVYYNTAVKTGTKYYYKVKAYVEVDGVKYYTDSSTKAWRTVK